MSVSIRPKTAALLSAAAALPLTAALVVAPLGAAQATHSPADKVVAAGSTLEVTDAASGPVELLSSTLKTSSPTDLMLAVTAECALWTDLTTTGNDSATAISRVEVWIEVDGEVVPVNSTDTATGDTGTPLEVGQAEAGHVVFCNRAFRATTSNFDDEDATIRLFNRTRQANAFNWLDLNLGAGEHTIKVYGDLTADTEGDATAKAAIGKRTLIVEPTKLANDATI